MIYKANDLNLRKTDGKKYGMPNIPALVILLAIFAGGVAALAILSFKWGDYFQGGLFALTALVFLPLLILLLIPRPVAVLAVDRLYFENADVLCQSVKGISAYSRYKGYVYYSDIQRAEYVPYDKSKPYIYANRVHVYADGKAIVLEVSRSLVKELTKRIANPPTVEKEAPAPIEVSPLWQEITEDFESGRLEAILPEELNLTSCKYYYGGYVEFMSHKDEIVFSVDMGSKMCSVVLTEDEIFLTESCNQRDKDDLSVSIKNVASAEEVYKAMVEFVNKEVMG